MTKNNHLNRLLSNIFLVFVIIFLGCAPSCQQSSPPGIPLNKPVIEGTVPMLETVSPEFTSTVSRKQIFEPSKTIQPIKPTNSPSVSETRYLALIAQDRTSHPQLFLYKLGANELLRPMDDSYTFEPLSWSPKGEFLVSSSITKEETDWSFLLYKIDVSKMQVDKLIPKYPEGESTAQMKMSNPAWSKENSQIVFSRDQEIHLIAPDRTARYLTQGYFPVWLDDSTAIALLNLYEDSETGKVYNFGDIFRYDLITKQRIQLTKGAKINFLASSPDGKWLAYTDLNHSDKIYIMKSDGSLQKKEIEVTAGAFSWDPDGNHLFVAFDCLIYRVGLDGAQIERVDLPRNYCYLYAAMQPMK